jgi:hypothetical protein
MCRGRGGLSVRPHAETCRRPGGRSRRRRSRPGQNASSLFTSARGLSPGRSSWSELAPMPGVDAHHALHTIDLQSAALRPLGFPRRHFQLDFLGRNAIACLRTFIQTRGRRRGCHWQTLTGAFVADAVEEWETE